MQHTRITKLLLLAVLGVLPAASAWALPPGAPPRGEYSRRENMRRPEGDRKNSKRQLEHFVMRVGFLEKNSKAKLSSSQAEKIVNLLAPWRKKSAMSEAQAKSLDQKLRAVLSTAQLDERKNLRPSRRGEGRRNDGEKRGGPDGKRRGGDKRDEPPTAAQQKEFKARMEKMRAFLKTYNPFYPPSNYQTVREMPERMQERFTRRYAQTTALLSQLSRKTKK